MEQEGCIGGWTDLIVITPGDAPHRLLACGPGRCIITNVGDHSWQGQEQFASLSHSEATLVLIECVSCNFSITCAWEETYLSIS